MHALAAHGLERVAIVDFDVHHGNGTEEIFADDERVLMASTFQHPFYPYSGTDHPAPNMVNVPLPAGTGSQGFRAGGRASVWLPRAGRLRAADDLLLGRFDAHVEDDMAMLRLVDQDYAWVTEHGEGGGRPPRGRADRIAARGRLQAQCARRAASLRTSRRSRNSRITMPSAIFDRGLDKTPANYAPLTPLGFLERSAAVFPQRLAVVHGPLRRTWARAVCALPATRERARAAWARAWRHGRGHAAQHAGDGRSALRHPDGGLRAQRASTRASMPAAIAFMLYARRSQGCSSSTASSPA